MDNRRQVDPRGGTCAKYTGHLQLSGPEGAGCMEGYGSDLPSYWTSSRVRGV